MSSPELAASKSDPLAIAPAEFSETAGLASQLRRWLPRLATFVVGQGMVQVLSLVTGFLLIHWLTVENYAAYSLVTGFQGTVGVLVELGLGSSIIALLAGRTDPSVVGGYIRSARHYRNRLFVMFLPIVAVAFVVLAFRQGWNWVLAVTALGAIIVALYGQSVATYYSAPLVVHQELGPYYRTSALFGILRLACCFGFNVAASLTSVTAVWIASASILAQGWFYRWQSSRHVIEPRMSEPATNHEVVSYIRPLIPGTIFFALQGQITILLISWFGQARSIAEIGALGRLAQLFLMLGAFNAVVIAPNVAQLTRRRLAGRYLQFLGGALVFAAGIVGASVLLPDVLLWMLGGNYSHLKNELVWMMAAASLNYIAGVMWTMHSARKWVFPRIVWAYIGASLAIEVLGIAFFDLSTTRSVLLLSLAVACTTIAVQIVWALYGFFFFESEVEERA